MVRTLGRSGIEVSAMGLGCWAIGGVAWRGDTPSGWGDVDDEESIRAIHAAIDAGVTFFDTADVYGAGHSEKTLAKAIKGRRGDVVIATKFGNCFDEATKQLTGSDATTDYIISACDASLGRLGIDYIDLYQFHLGGHDPEEAAEVRETCERLVEQGKIRWYGWSTDDPDRERVFAEGPHCTSVQHQQNVMNDNGQMLELCEELDLASINRGPLAMGLLTGKYGPSDVLPENDVRGPNAPSWMRYFKDGRANPELLQKLASIREILSSEGRSLAQGALAWIWARSGKTIPIPGFKSVKQATENAAAMDHGPLTAQQLSEIDTILGRSA